MKRIQMLALGGAIVAVLATATPAVAEASPAATTISPTQEVQVRALLTKFDVPSAQQDSLIAKTNAGQTWDVYLNRGPTTTEHRTIGDMDYRITRYPDGSVQAGGIERPHAVATGGVQPQSINSCTYSTGTGYHNATGCIVDGLWGSVYLAAHNVSYSNIQGGYDQITGTGYSSMSCSIVTCTTPTKIINVTHESASGAAHVRWQSDITNSIGVPKSWNIWFQINVGSDTAWQTNS